LKFGDILGTYLAGYKLEQDERHLLTLPACCRYCHSMSDNMGALKPQASNFKNMHVTKTLQQTAHKIKIMGK